MAGQYGLGASDDIHPVLWRCGLQTNTLCLEEFVKGEGHWSYVKVDTKYVPHDLVERYDMSTTHVSDVIHPVLWRGVVSRLCMYVCMYVCMYDLYSNYVCIYVRTD